MHSYQYEILLTKKEYETISADFGNEAKRVLQIDFFYDTPELFLDRPPESSGNIPMSVKEQGTTVRIRHREGVLQGTILQQQARADLPYPNETCFTVERLPLTLDYNGKTLRLCAQLITERLQITPGAGIELLLDKNYYYGIVDYELTIAYEKSPYRTVWAFLIWSGETAYGPRRRRAEWTAFQIGGVPSSKQVIPA